MEDMETLPLSLSLTSNGLLDFLLLLYLELMSLIGGAGPGAVCPRGEEKREKRRERRSEEEEPAVKGRRSGWFVHAHNRNLLLGVCVCVCVCL